MVKQDKLQCSLFSSYYPYLSAFHGRQGHLGSDTFAQESRFDGLRDFSLEV